MEESCHTQLACIFVMPMCISYTYAVSYEKKLRMSRYMKQHQKGKVKAHPDVLKLWGSEEGRSFDIQCPVYSSHVMWPPNLLYICTYMYIHLRYKTSATTPSARQHDGGEYQSSKGV